MQPLRPAHGARRQQGRREMTHLVRPICQKCGNDQWFIRKVVAYAMLHYSGDGECETGLLDDAEPQGVGPLECAVCGAAVLDAEAATAQLESHHETLESAMAEVGQALIGYLRLRLLCLRALKEVEGGEALG